MWIQELPQIGIQYGYRLDGPRGWHQGHRFEINIILIDPYAKLIEGRRFCGDASNKMSKFLGTYDFNSLPFNWGDNYKLPNIPEVNLVTCLNALKFWLVTGESLIVWLVVLSYNCFSHLFICFSFSFPFIVGTKFID